MMMDAILVLEIIVGIVLYIMGSNARDEREMINKKLEEIATNTSGLNKKTEFYENLLKTIENIEDKKFKDTKLFAAIYADQRKALVQLYNEKLTFKAKDTDAHIKALTDSFHEVLKKSKEYQYKLAKYEQLFPWIKEFENADLSLATEEFYAKNNLPACGWRMAEKFKEEKIAAYTEIEKAKKYFKQYQVEATNRFNRACAEVKANLERENLEAKANLERERAEIKEERSKIAGRTLDSIKKARAIEGKEQDLLNRTRELNMLKDELAKKEEVIKDMEESHLLQVKDIPVLASFFSETLELKDVILEEKLRFKNPPAMRAADEVRAIRTDKRKWVERCKAAEYKVLYYEQIAPWLIETEDEKLVGDTCDVFNVEYDNKEDAVGYWLTKEEYMALPTQEKYQKALDRYCRRNKTNAEIGRDYERYIGYRYEKDGWDVEYRGIIDGYEDRGRDLICRKDGITHIVQCKYWSSRKEIHENHINQLFGTTVKYYLEQNSQASFDDFIKSLLGRKKSIVPIFRTSTKLSDTAKEFAKALGIKVIENDKMGEYPMIKCNIGKNDEKIYHLPFDQQYDKIKIDREGEFFANTVKEAERAGFRRAKRWRSDFVK